MSQPFPSPVQDRFASLVESAEHNLFLTAPYITRPPLEEIASILQRRETPPAVQILTCIEESNLARGSFDAGALYDFASTFPQSIIQHREMLHAKVYIADAHSAIVTSANLTRGGLHSNLEYGILIQEATTVEQIQNDMNSYARLAANFTIDDLQILAEETPALIEAKRKAEKTINVSSSERLRTLLNQSNEHILGVQARGESTNSLFSKLVIYVLETLGPLTTQELHPFIQLEAPSLCDNNIDRVINGVRFGKKWKHNVRNAQKHLQRKGVITQDADRRWHLT
ncbi:MAG: phospholipase D-like domain-containing protein [Anaerolineaceae bacterium]|nr:phospholipase D-like domain-containing protein [Anaerolineaceae bacterium]